MPRSVKGLSRHALASMLGVIGSAICNVEGDGENDLGSSGGGELSLRDSLSEALEASKAAGGGESAPAPAAAPVAAPEKPADSAAPRADGRDASGRFTPKASVPAAEAQSPAGQPGADADQAAGDAPRPPKGWTATAKAKFASLDPDIQAEISRREREIEHGFTQQQTRLELANRFDALMQPFRDRLAMEGLDPIQGVQRLLAAQSALEKDPVAALLHLARSYGVPPARLAQAAGVQQPPHPGTQAQLPPGFQTLAQQVQHLQSQLSQRDQAERTQRFQSVQSEIQAFQNDPANLYFANVREDMIALLAQGRAKDLKDAYDKAVWANPETRQLIQADQSRKAEADRLNAQRQQTNGARRAAGSVTGAPSPGLSPAAAGNPNSSVRDDVKAAFAAHRV